MNVGGQRRLRRNEIVLSVVLDGSAMPDTQRGPLLCEGTTLHTALRMHLSSQKPKPTYESMSQAHKGSAFDVAQLERSDYAE